MGKTLMACVCTGAFLSGISVFFTDRTDYKVAAFLVGATCAYLVSVMTEYLRPKD